MKNFKRLIASIITFISLLAINPTAAHAEWRKDNTGWWYKLGNSWVTGWATLDGGKYYYFDSNGYMAHDTTIEGYKLGSDGAWVITDPATNEVVDPKADFWFDKKTGTITTFTKAYKDTVVIPSTIDGVTVTRIGDKVFAYYTGLKSITIPDSVTSIGKNAFYQCVNLTTINANEKNTDIVKQQINHFNKQID